MSGRHSNWRRRWSARKRGRKPARGATPVFARSTQRTRQQGERSTTLGASTKRRATDMYALIWMMLFHQPEWKTSSFLTQKDYEFRIEMCEWRMN